MDAIDILINEHMYIKKVLRAVKKDCEEMAYGKDVDVELYKNVIDFVRNFADKYHHQKEEKRLFNIMSEKNESIKRGPIMGMLLEHDLGREYIRNLAEAIEGFDNGDKAKKAYIIANALSYVIMLEKHIEKEDTNIYMTARRVIDENIRKEMNNEFYKIENDENNKNIRKKYIKFAESL